MIGLSTVEEAWVGLRTGIWLVIISGVESSEASFDTAVSPVNRDSKTGSIGSGNSYNS
jgi:hypothetical protein